MELGFDDDSTPTEKVFVPCQFYMPKEKNRCRAGLLFLLYSDAPLTLLFYDRNGIHLDYNNVMYKNTVTISIFKCVFFIYSNYNAN